MYPLIKKILFSLPPETAHDWVKIVGKYSPSFWLKALTGVQSDRLTSQIGQTPLKNPIGLAAGFDKNAEVVSFMENLGFGFLEIGSVTYHPCEGNPKPRLFRLPEELSLVNRLGLPNWGVDKVSYHLGHVRHKIPLGMNIAKTPDFVKISDKRKEGVEDYLATFKKLHQHGAYTVLNLSCPNTKEKTTFEDSVLFSQLATTIAEERTELKDPHPVLVKISPTLEEKNLEKLIDQVFRHNLDGFVISNTLPCAKQGGVSGGLSGRGLSEAANKQLKKVYAIVKNEKIIMGVGGILNFDDLLLKLSSGASLFQIYTGLIYNGPFFVKDLLRKLDAYCKKQGVKNYQELVGQKLL